MENISQRQLRLIGVAYILDATLISVPNQVIASARMDTWFSMLLAFLAMILPLWAAAAVAKRFPDQDLFTILAKRFPIVGRVMIVLILLFFFMILIRDIRMITDFVNVTLLPKTPITVIAVLIVATSWYVSRGGIEILGRMTELWLPGFIITVLLIPLGLFREFDFHVLLPVLGNGISAPLQGSWYVVSYIGEIIALPFLFSNKTFRFRDGLIALSIGTGTLFLIIIYTVLALGIYVPTKTFYPSYEMVRQIALTDFLDRFDLPLVGVYAPTLLTKIAFSHYLLGHGLQRLSPKLSAKVLLAPIGIFAYVCSFWFYANGVQLLDFNRAWTLLALGPEFLLPLGFFFFLRPKKKKAVPSSN